MQAHTRKPLSTTQHTTPLGVPSQVKLKRGGSTPGAGGSVNARTPLGGMSPSSDERDERGQVRATVGKKPARRRAGGEDVHAYTEAAPPEGPQRPQPKQVQRVGVHERRKPEPPPTQEPRQPRQPHPKQAPKAPARADVRMPQPGSEPSGLQAGSDAPLGARARTLPPAKPTAPRGSGLTTEYHLPFDSSPQAGGSNWSKATRAIGSLPPIVGDELGWEAEESPGASPKRPQLHPHASPKQLDAAGGSDPNSPVYTSPKHLQPIARSPLGTWGSPTSTTSKKQGSMGANAADEVPASAGWRKLGGAVQAKPPQTEHDNLRQHAVDGAAGAGRAEAAAKAVRDTILQPQQGAGNSIKGAKAQPKR